MEFHLRELTGNDNEETIRHLWREDLLSVQGNKQDTLDYIRRHLEKDMGDILRIYSGSKGRFFILEKGKELCGFIGVLLQENCYRIQRLNVLKAYRGKGLGNKLFLAAFQWASKYSSSIRAYTDSNNHASNRILQKKPHRRKQMGSIVEYIYY